jgi:hypothetical protein
LLDLSGNQLTSASLELLWLTARHLNLSNNLLQSTIPSPTSGVITVESLDLSFNSYIGGLPFAMLLLGWRTSMHLYFNLEWNCLDLSTSNPSNDSVWKNCHGNLDTCLYGSQYPQSYMCPTHGHATPWSPANVSALAGLSSAEVQWLTVYPSIPPLTEIVVSAFRDGSAC